MTLPSGLGEHSGVTLGRGRASDRALGVEGGEKVSEGMNEEEACAATLVEGEDTTPSTRFAGSVAGVRK